MLGFANIRKTKAHTVTLALLFIIASMLLNIGLMVFLNFGSFFDKTVEELNTSDAFYLIPQSMFTEEVEYYIDTHDEITDIEKSEGIFIYGKMPWGDEERGMAIIFRDMNIKSDMTKWKYISEKQDAGKNSVYLPYAFKVSGGYNLGDTLNVKLADKSYSFTVAGFTEDVMFSSTDMGFLSMYLPSERYAELYDDLSEYREKIISANIKKNYKTVESGLINLTGAGSSFLVSDEKSSIYSSDIVMMKMSRTMMANMLSVMMVVFSFIIVIVCLLVIRFRIGNSIEEDMPKIGSLKSIGYTSGQITASIVAQYGLIALAGCIIGIPPAYLAIPAVSDVFALQTGLLWRQGFAPVLNLAVIGILMFIVIVVTFIAALKIKKISPVVALRGGITTHSFKKNHMPLEKTHMHISSAMSFKSVLQNFKQSAMLFVIITAVAFTGAFALIMFYNAAVDSSTFSKVPGIELCNAALIFDPSYDTDELAAEVLALDNVNKVQYLDDSKLVVDGTDINAVVMSDYSEKETNTVYKGRYPIHDNEIAIAGVFSTMIDKTIGDTVMVGKTGNELPYIITGLTQGAGNGGAMKVFVTTNGILKVAPDFRQISLMVYLNKGENAAVFIEQMNKKYGEKLLVTSDIDKGFEDAMGSYITIISSVGEVILIVAALVVILVLYFVIGSSVIRKRRELGIQKAVGFTTWQLMNQVSLGFVFPLIIGITAGCLLGAYLGNPIMSAAMIGMGVMKANFIVQPMWVIIFGLGMLVVSYLTSMVITWRIRKISAYALVTE